jgi:hypothetical protein
MEELKKQAEEILGRKLYSVETFLVESMWDKGLNETWELGKDKIGHLILNKKDATKENS